MKTSLLHTTFFKNQKDESLKCQKENFNTFRIKLLGFSKVFLLLLLFIFLVFRGEDFLRYKKIPNIKKKMNKLDYIKIKNFVYLTKLY